MPFRERLDQTSVARARRERLDPRPSDPHYLHLDTLRDALGDIFTSLLVGGRILDLFCGTQPYRPLMNSNDVIAFDIDDRFGTPDVYGSTPLPFATGSFDAVVCTQTIYLLDDPAALIADVGRTLRSSGAAIISVPLMFRPEGSEREHRYSIDEFTNLFDGWQDVEIIGTGGMGTGAAYWLGAWMAGLFRRIPAATGVAGVAFTVMNRICQIADRVVPATRPATIIAVARPPSD